jgi:hypothetical protein
MRKQEGRGFMRRIWRKDTAENFGGRLVEGSELYCDGRSDELILLVRQRTQ